MDRKVFTSKTIKDIFYEVVGEGWMDKDTYLIVFQPMTDADGDDFHMEVEYHKDTDEIVYARCYEDEVMVGTDYVSNCFKLQIEEYLLKKVGVIDEEETIITSTIEFKLKVAVPLDMTISEYNELLKNITINASELKGVKLLGVEKK